MFWGSRARWRALMVRVFPAALVLGAVLVLAQHLPVDVDALEVTLARLGWWGPAGFIVGYVVLTPLFVPAGGFAIAAGALFGVFRGTVYLSVAALAAAAFVFVLSREFLGEWISRRLTKYPKLAAVHRAADRKGLRLLVLLRLTPLSYALQNYVLGASRVRFSTFIVSCLVMVPKNVVTVYFGYTARHVATISGQADRLATLRAIAMATSVIFAVTAVTYVTRLAYQAILLEDTATQEVEVDLMDS
jgi:uncharacterized membrane protein YdjX (TVP38/TMEM64 family)